MDAKPVCPRCRGSQKVVVGFSVEPCPACQPQDYEKPTGPAPASYAAMKQQTAEQLRAARRQG